MTRWQRLNERPPPSQAAPIRLAKMAKGCEDTKVLLIIRDRVLVDKLRRSLLRNGIWCAACLSQAEVFPMLSALPFSAIVTDLDDPQLETADLLAQIPLEYEKLNRIALTRRMSLRKQLSFLAEHVLLQPVDMTELVSAILESSAETSPRPRV